MKGVSDFEAMCLVTVGEFLGLAREINTETPVQVCVGCQRGVSSHNIALVLKLVYLRETLNNYYKFLCRDGSGDGFHLTVYLNQLDGDYKNFLNTVDVDRLALKEKLEEDEYLCKLRNDHSGWWLRLPE